MIAAEQRKIERLKSSDRQNRCPKRGLDPILLFSELACYTYRIDFSVLQCYTLQNVFSSTVDSIGIHAQNTRDSDRTLS